MTLCLVWHESRKVGWCSRNKALSSLSSQCLYMFLYLSSGRSGDHRGLRLWPGFPIFHHVLMVAVHFRNPLRGCAGFRPFDCRNRYARGVGGLRCRPGHHTGTKSLVLIRGRTSSDGDIAMPFAEAPSLLSSTFTFNLFLGETHNVVTFSKNVVSCRLKVSSLTIRHSGTNIEKLLITSF